MFQIAKILPRQRLLTILGEYGEYPSHYRQLIWQHLLKLPNNTLEYCNLIEKCAHNRPKFHDRSFRPFDADLRKNLQQLLFYLMKWSQILSMPFDEEHHFLPYFVFLFLKFNSTNLLQCFELIATILINQCGLWFEFSPLLPFNYLGLVDNLIEHYKPTLMQFYRRHSIDSSVYAWPMLRTAFSEILEEFQWMQLWDHIVSAPSYFLVFVVVAFNCIQRSAIEQLKNPNEIRRYFDEPSSINLRAWIRCAYELMENCPSKLHPKQYMPDFVRLDLNGQYRKISNYPQHCLRKRIQRKNQVKHQMHQINRKYMDLDKFEMELMQQWVNNAQIDEHNRRMQKVELSHELAAMNQSNRIEYQRQQLILSERQLNDREALMKLISAENERMNVNHRRAIDMQKNACDFNKRVSKTNGTQ